VCKFNNCKIFCISILAENSGDVKKKFFVDIQGFANLRFGRFLQVVFGKVPNFSGVKHLSKVEHMNFSEFAQMVLRNFQNPPFPNPA